MDARFIGYAATTILNKEQRFTLQFGFGSLLQKALPTIARVVLPVIPSSGPRLSHPKAQYWSTRISLRKNKHYLFPWKQSRLSQGSLCFLLTLETKLSTVNRSRHHCPNGRTCDVARTTASDSATFSSPLQLHKVVQAFEIRRFESWNYALELA